MPESSPANSSALADLSLPDSWRQPLPDGSDLDMIDFPSVLLVGATTLIQRNLTRPVLESLDLGVPEWRLLAFLHESGRTVAGEIASRTWMDKAQISRAMDSLVARGLARRESDPLHRQRLLVELTPSGRRLHARAFEATRVMQSQLLTMLSLSERKGLYAALKKMYAFAESAAPGLPGGTVNADPGELKPKRRRSAP